MKVLAVLLVGCGGASYELATPSPFDECAYLSCPLALGTQVDVLAEVDTDVEESIDVTAIEIIPADLADATFDGDHIAVTPRRTGDGTIRATVPRGVMERHIRIESIATTAIVPLGLPDDVGPIALFPGATLTLASDHRDGLDEHLLGHGVEIWTATGTTLDVVDASYYDDAGLMRAVIAPASGAIAISDGNATIAFDVVPHGSAARLALGDSNTVALFTHEQVSVDVRAFAADGRYLHGGIGLAAAIDDPTVATVAIGSDVRRRIDLVGLAVGNTAITIDFEGAQLRVPISVR